MVHEMKKSPDEFAKAVVGAGVAALTAMGTAVTTGDGTLDGVDASGWIAVAIAFLSTFAAVYFVPNSQKASAGASVQPSQSAGAPSTVQPQQAVGGATTYTHRSQQVAPSYPNPPGMKG